MQHAPDEIHDLAHVERVVKTVERLSKTIALTAKEKEAVILAAWWHDVGRTVLRRPSLVCMTLFDDMISALMLWGATIKYGLFGSVAGMSTRIIFCKSFGSGKLFTKLFLRKKSRILLHILEDADAIDLLHVSRVQVIQNMIPTSPMMRVSYKFLVWWSLSSKLLAMKTNEGKKSVNEVLENLVAWMERPSVYAWHETHFGKEWSEKNLARLKQYILSKQQ